MWRWGFRAVQLEKLYKGVYLPIVTYAPATWPSSVCLDDRRKLWSSQRKALLTVAGRYNDTSHVTLHLITGNLPLDLEIGWRRQYAKGSCLCGTKAEKERLKKEKEEAIQKWKEMWEKEQKNHITRQFIPDLKIRLEKGLVVGTHVTQLLTGHGDLESYLLRRRKRTEAVCTKCRCRSEDRPEEDVLHVIWDCQNPERVQAREDLESQLNPRSWPCPLPALLEQGGRPFAVFARKVLSVKTCHPNA